MKKKVVFFQGAFDFINYGHIRCIQRAAKLGDILIIGLNTDDLYRDYKGREPVMFYRHKKVVLEALRCVTKVVPARSFSPMALLKKYKPDVYVVAKEWIETKPEEVAFMKSIGGKISITPRYRGGMSTTEIKKRILFLAQNGELGVD
jgi:rfaE bifunctional protein nucleotidyltransferase chain/domain